MLTNAIIFGILLGVSILGQVLRAGLILIAAGLGMVIFGFTLWSSYTWLSIVLVIVGIIVVWQGAK